jgi:hypothetical protein
VQPTRVQRMLGRLDLGASSRETLDGLCGECAREFNVTGAGIALIVGGTHRGSLGASDQHMRGVEELQVTFAEGPCMDAHREGLPVFEPVLADGDRWSLFTPAALEAGIQAVFAFPLQSGSARYGALDLYRSGPGPLSPEDIADAGSIAKLITSLVLVTQAGAPPGALPEAIDDLMDESSVVHQAAGMVSIQLDIGIEDANVALRAHAYASDRRLKDVAAEVVARKIRFDP